MDENDEILREFLVESNENLDQLDRDLVALEKDPTARETLASVFRAIHTLKGTTGFLGFSKLESIAHVGESLLGRLRDGVLLLDPEITSGLLAMVDAIRTILSNIETQNQEGDEDYSALVEALGRLGEGGKAAETPAAAPAAPTVPSAPPQPPTPAETAAEPASSAPAVMPLGEMLVRNSVVVPEEVHKAIERQIGGDPRHLGEILVDQGVVAPSAVLEAVQEQKESRSLAASSSTIRVDVQQLDKLMNLVGELVLARNQILQFSARQQDSAFLSTTQRLNLITTELQEGVMKTRMQPIDNIWNKFPRVVRDLATSCGKRVRVEMEGKETELDKTLIEAIKDPLTHIVRNSVDHGIERPEQREARGKPAEGRLFLRAYHEGGQVNIEISDDGAGIAVDRVKRKAVERGLVTPEQAARMGEREALNLILLPGLSTAEKVTNVSGRGVGMDVVKTNIEKIGGTVDIQSQPGGGTILKIKIPLTLAIIPALIVTSGGDRYAIPQISLLELVRLEGDGARKGIEFIHGAPVYRLRGNLLPLIYLNHELGLAAQNAARAAESQEAVNIVVLQADDHPFGLVVDAVNDTEEIVVKPLSKHLKGITAFAGATIMGDGRVALILDVLGLAHRAHVVSEVRERALADRNARAAAASGDRQTLLLFQSPDNGHMAIPLGLVTRLEEFPRSAIEKAGNQEMVQYRDSILPLVRLSSLLGERRRKARRPLEAPSSDEPVQVVVYSDRERTVGLIVERILDIVEEDLARKQAASRSGILGTLVVHERVTEILDLEGLIRTHAALHTSKNSMQKVSR